MAARVGMDLLRRLHPQLLGSQVVPIEKTITNAQVLALFTTAVQITDLPGADKIWVPELCVIEKPAGTAFTVVGVTDVQIGYGATLAPVAFSIDESGFLNSASLESRIARPRATTAGGAFPDITAISLTGPVNLRNQALFIKAAGANPAAGTSPLRVHFYGRIVPVNLTFSW